MELPETDKTLKELTSGLTKKEEIVTWILLCLGILAGIFRFDGLCVFFGLMFVTTFIENAIKSLKNGEKENG